MKNIHWTHLLLLDKAEMEFRFSTCRQASISRGHFTVAHIAVHPDHQIWWVLPGLIRIFRRYVWTLVVGTFFLIASLSRRKVIYLARLRAVFFYLKKANARICNNLSQTLDLSFGHRATKNVYLLGIKLMPIDIFCSIFGRSLGQTMPQKIAISIKNQAHQIGSTAMILMDKRHFR